MASIQVKSVFVAAFVSALVAVGCSQNKSSSNNSANTGLIYEERSSQVDSKVCGLLAEVKYNGEEPESFMLAQSLPEIWIVEKNGTQNAALDCNQGKIKLSEAARKLLEKHWIDRIENRYFDGYLESPRGDEGLKIDYKLSNSIIKTQQQLIVTPVSDEKNIRNITSREADEMILLIRDWSREILNTVEASKN